MKTDGHGQARTGDGLIPRHGGFRKLKTFQLSTLIFDVTVLFTSKFIDPRSRTRDQMDQAARSGRQNIAEGSADSATSKKMEMKLTGVAKGSLEELRLDYEDFLRQRGLPLWPPDHPALQRFKARRCATLEEFRAWVADEVRRAKAEAAQSTAQSTDEHGQTQTGKSTDGHGQTPTGMSTDGHGQTPTGMSTDEHGQTPTEEMLPQTIAANGALCLLNLCIYLLEKQLQAQAAAFERKGGFTERLYQQRTRARAVKSG
jgi:four helix bundle suffix protein